MYLLPDLPMSICWSVSLIPAAAAQTTENISIYLMLNIIHNTFISHTNLLSVYFESKIYN